MKKKKEGEPSDKLVLKQAVRKKVNYMLKKPNIDPGDAYNLIKNFFKVFTNHDYEFTREELIKELDKVYLDEATKKRCEEIINALGVVEFYETNLTQEEIRKNITEFADIVEKLVHHEGVKLGFWDEFADKFRRKSKKEKTPVKHETTLMEKFLEEVDHEKIDENVEEIKTENPKEPDIVTIPVEETKPEETKSPDMMTMKQEPASNPLAALEQAGAEEIMHEMQEQEPGLLQPEQIESELKELQEKLDQEEINETTPAQADSEEKQETTDQTEVKQAEPEVKDKSVEMPDWATNVQDPPDFHETNAGEVSITEKFDTMVQSFYQHLSEGNLDTARLEYEEMMYEYQSMPQEKKEIYYEKLMKVYDDLQEKFSQI